eukprot:1912580-Rhodomonas_salina.2
MGSLSDVSDLTEPRTAGNFGDAHQVEPLKTKTMAARKLWMPDVAYEAEARRGVATPTRVPAGVTVSSAPSAEVSMPAGPRLPARGGDLKPPNAAVNLPAPGQGPQISEGVRNFVLSNQSPSTEFPAKRTPPKLSDASFAAAASPPSSKPTKYADYSFDTSPGQARIRGPPLAKSSLPWYVEGDSPAQALELSKTPVIESPAWSPGPITPDHRAIIPKPLPTSPAVAAAQWSANAAAYAQVNAAAAASASASKVLVHAVCQTDAEQHINGAKSARKEPAALAPEVQLQLRAQNIVVLHSGVGALGTRREAPGCWCRRKGLRKVAVSKFRNCSLVATCTSETAPEGAGLCSSLKFFFDANGDGKYSSVDVDENAKIHVKGRRVELVRCVMHAGLRYATLRRRRGRV